MIEYERMERPLYSEWPTTWATDSNVSDWVKTALNRDYDKVVIVENAFRSVKFRLKPELPFLYLGPSNQWEPLKSTAFEGIDILLNECSVYEVHVFSKNNVYKYKLNPEYKGNK